MWIFKKIDSLQQYLNQQRKDKQRIGFAPTMGALHQGHLSLLSQASRENGLAVASIFVNPTQFNDPNDLEKYPRPIENDIEMLTEAGCDVLFLPDVSEIYPTGSRNWVSPFNFGELARVMEGAHRPGHFEGMAQVVQRLLDIVQPDRLYMGQKDFQQQTIVGAMLAQLQLPTELICCAIVREADGLAMSSRNIRLSPTARAQAPAIYALLQQAKKDRKNGLSPIQVRARALEKLAALPHFELDYLEIVDAKTLQPILNWHDAAAAVVCLTVRLDGVRLLDNIRI